MKHTGGGSFSRFDFFTGAGYHRYHNEVNQVKKKLVCPKCGGSTSATSKTLWGMCAICALKSSPHLMDAASWTPPGEAGVLWKPPVAEPTVVYKATDKWMTPNYDHLAEFGKDMLLTGAGFNMTPCGSEARTTEPGPVQRDFLKMTVEDVILDFGCRVWEAV